MQAEVVLLRVAEVELAVAEVLVVVAPAGVGVVDEGLYSGTVCQWPLSACTSQLPVDQEGADGGCAGAGWWWLRARMGGRSRSRGLRGRR
jgi:hypothetical protein